MEIDMNGVILLDSTNGSANNALIRSGILYSNFRSLIYESGLTYQ
jgi:hypothetical protein